MSMVLFYERINWEDFPSVNTAINAIRLNKMDYAVKTMDERTVALDTAKAEKSVVLNTIKDWSLDEKTGIITITKVNGDVLNFDLNIEKIPVKFELSEDGILTMTTDDGSKFTADIGSMIPVIEFRGSDTITVAKYINNGIDKTYSFTVKDGSITEKKLQPNYLADIKVQAENAELSATASTESAKESKSYAIGGTGTREGEDTDNAKYYAELAKENIEPVMNAVSDIALNRQTLGYVKKNLYDNIGNFVSSAYSGVDVSRGKDDTFDIKGTATANVNVVQKPFSLPVGKYIISRKINGGMSIALYNRTKTNFIIYNLSTTGTEFKVTDENDILDIRLQGITGGVYNVTGQAIMIRPAEITDPTYEPYVEDVDTRLKALTPVANLITTVAGKPLDAIMGKELNDKILAVDGKIIFSETEPTTVEAGKIVMVYE